ncbi:hypothetical protein ZIOFF_025577 [Zingiber officinale]|uniref:Uncharacterized protein n=1 Tax=Zingiber officinale TaxID=94328 RepID=A0A8J5LH84_ZINOF|nr:hypothetical protein ZIOFF_025577 [Zingiber officinale]
MLCAGKGSWPELVGVDGEEAAAVIIAENRGVTTRIVEMGSFVIQDFRCDRVWVWVDKQGKVARVPIVG